jgi:hypothetical protein
MEIIYSQKVFMATGTDPITKFHQKTGAPEDCSLLESYAV